VPVDEVAARLGRSRPAILARARALGLHWYQPRPDQSSLGHTLGDVARLLGVNSGTVRRWVTAGWLPAARREVRLGRHALWLVWDDDLARFLSACRPVYEFARIRDPYWRAFVAALPPERDPWLTPCEAAPLLGCTAHGPPLGRALLPPPQRARPARGVLARWPILRGTEPCARRSPDHRCRRLPPTACGHGVSTS